MNKSLLLLAVAASSVQLAQAGLTDLFKKAKETVSQVTSLAGQPKEYQKGANANDKLLTPISVEIKNKGDVIWVAIKTGGSFYQLKGKHITKISAGATQGFTADIDQPYEIFIWTSEPASTEVAPTKKYSIPANETAYVTADEGGVLRPQTGPLEGRLKKTDTGLSFSKNVKAQSLVAA